MVSIAAPSHIRTRALPFSFSNRAMRWSEMLRRLRLWDRQLLSTTKNLRSISTAILRLSRLMDLAARRQCLGDPVSNRRN